MKKWKSLLAGLLLAVMLVPSAAAASDRIYYLPDIEGHWAQEAIATGISYGWVSGYPDHTFRPDGTVTRAEFTKMLLGACFLEPGSETVEWMSKNAYALKEKVNQWGNKYYESVAYKPRLTDMSDHWLTRQGWLDAAMYSGLVVPSDYNNLNFRPEKPITRYEIALMTTRALGLVYPAQQPLKKPLPYTDSAVIKDWVKGYVSEATRAGILKGYPDGSFGPNKTATRAEAATMILRTMNAMMEGLYQTDARVCLSYDVHGTIDGVGGIHTMTQDITGNTRCQIVDGLIYVNLQDVAWAYETLTHPGTAHSKYGWAWYPIEQIINGSAFPDAEHIYQAGNANCLDGTYLMGYVSPDDLPDTMLGPARLLYGEIMIPVYDLNDPDRTCNSWKESWDPETRTLTISPYIPYFPIS